MITDPSSPKRYRWLPLGPMETPDGEWVKYADHVARLAQLAQQLAAANDERRALKLAVVNGDEAKMSTFPTEQILRLIACYREDTEIMDALPPDEDLAELRARLQAKAQLIAQLAQEQATLQASLDSLYGAKFSDRVYVALKARAETAEAALGETRQALQQLYLAARQTLSALDGVDISRGTTIWIKERERLDAALAHVDHLLSQRPA